MDNIVVGYADTPVGNVALQEGIEAARRHGARLHVLHFVRVGIRNERPEVITHYRDLMASIGERLRDEGIDGRSELIMVGKDRGDAILGELRELDADLLVIGSRWRSPGGAKLLGSTEQHLLLRADCPILVVKTRAR